MPEPQDALPPLPWERYLTGAKWANELEHWIIRDAMGLPVATVPAHLEAVAALLLRAPQVEEAARETAENCILCLGTGRALKGGYNCLQGDDCPACRRLRMALGDQK